MERERNLAVVRGYLDEVVSKGNIAAFDLYFDADVSFNGSQDAARKKLTGMGVLRVAFPDYHLTIEDQIADGDTVVTRVRFRGTHRGQFNGIAPTGKQIAYPGIAMDRLVDGKVVEMWHVASPLGLLDQIAVVVRAGVEEREISVG